MFRTIVLHVFALAAASVAVAKGVYFSNEEFLAKSFVEPPQAKTLWLKAERKQTLESILGHPVGLRSRYWLSGKRSAWIFEEIGKDLPITIGVVVEDQRIVDVTILAFRESRGGEVRYPFFTDQFKQVGLTGEQKLDQHIDGISGATLSYWAVTRSARAALFLHQVVVNGQK
jgi:uncharacterized protein with FMN-binding domain